MFCGFNFCTNSGANAAEKEGTHSFLPEFSRSEDPECLLCGGIVFGRGREVNMNRSPCSWKTHNLKEEKSLEEMPSVAPTWHDRGHLEGGETALNMGGGGGTSMCQHGGEGRGGEIISDGDWHDSMTVR